MQSINAGWLNAAAVKLFDASVLEILQEKHSADASFQNGRSSIDRASLSHTLHPSAPRAQICYVERQDEFAILILSDTHHRIVAFATV